MAIPVLHNAMGVWVVYRSVQTDRIVYGIRFKKITITVFYPFPEGSSYLIYDCLVQLIG